MPPFELNPENAQRLLDSVPVRYLMYEEGFTQKYVSNILQKHPELWEQIYSDPTVEFKIYKRVQAPDNGR
ncbi:MAG: hypothetical protein AUG74_17355 [Bacteroidetes bacterium 13_1_20CM_4_60_6]|nr:MAG: hypothetical protein AUG74_17355 [Bacteroidetes bacterium 13_1_20CM_4_60_6]